jgi:hypothetical protein
MACSNGRVNLKADEDRQLFSESAGTCLLCCMPLFAATPVKRSVLIAERAHIVGHSEEGPRGDPSVGNEDRGSISNIVLLCPTCHTMADKAPEDYPADTLRALKRRRMEAVALIGGTPTFATRGAARAAVVALLARSRVTFEQFGPSPTDGSLPSVEDAEKWSEKVLDTIVPSHDMVVSIVVNNPEIAEQADQTAAEKLRLHAIDLLNKHSGLPLAAPAMKFPAEAEAIFT